MPKSVLDPYLEAMYPRSADRVRRSILGRIRDTPVKSLGAGGFGVAYALKSGRALKLTSDADEMRTAAYLLTVEPPSVLTKVYDAFLVRPEFDWQPPTGVIVRDLVDSTLSRTKKKKSLFPQEPLVAEAINAAHHGGHLAQIDYSIVGDVPMDDPDAVCEGMEAYIDVLDTYIDSGKLRGRAFNILTEYRMGIEELLHAGICGSDFRVMNVGYDSEEDRLVIFDLGRTSSPEETVPELRIMKNPPEGLDVLRA